MVLYVVYVVASRRVQVGEFPKSLAILSRSTFLWQRWNFWDYIPLFLRTASTFQRTWTPQKVQKTWWKGWSALLRYRHHHHTYTLPLYKSPSSYFRWFFTMPFPSSLKSLNDNHLWNPGAVGSERDHGLQVTPLLRRRRLGQHHPVNCSLYTRGMQLTQC